MGWAGSALGKGQPVPAPDQSDTNALISSQVNKFAFKKTIKINIFVVLFAYQLYFITLDWTN